jgi:hypothetical protein
LEVTSTAELALSGSLPRARLATQIALALALAVVLRLPAFAWGVISDDEAIYDAMAQVVNRGGVMYRDALDHKPPGLVYVYAAVERIAGAHASPALRIGLVHLLGLLLALLTAAGLVLVARELLRRELWWVPAALYGIASTAKCAYDGLAVNGELLMNAPTVFAIAAVLFAGRASRGKRLGWDLLAAVLIGVAGLAKWQALATGLAFPFLVAREDRSTFLDRLSRRGPVWLLGVALPIAATAAYFEAHGVLADAWRWGGLFNARYISDGPGTWWALERFAIGFGSVIVPSAALYLAGLAGLRKQLRKGARGQLGLVIWAVVSMLCVGLGGRFFGHYFLQAELPLCLLAAEPLSRWFSRAPAWTASAVAVPAAVFFVFSLSPSMTRALFDPGAPNWARIGQEVASHSAPGDSLFVWGNVPPLYSLTNRPMGTRFSFCNYLTGLSPGTPSEYDPSVQTRSTSEAWPLLLDDLEHRKPALILDTAAAGWKGYGKYPIARFPEFAAYVSAHYREAERIDGAVLLRRID